MAFDGITTKAILCELNNCIIGAKINKVFEPTKNEIVLGLYNNGINYALELSANPESCRICLTTHSKPNPQNAYNFCMLLRKYLIGSKITKISNYDLERTVEINFECYNELNDLVTRKLFIEIMSRQSNIILTNENNIIIDTLKHSDTKRELLPAHPYTFAPINKISFIKTNFNDFIKMINSYEEKNLSKILTNSFIGFSRPFINETLQNLNIDKNKYNISDLNTVYNYINNIILNLGTTNIICKKIKNKDYTIVLNNKEIKNSLNNNDNTNSIQNLSDNNFSKNNLNINFFIDDFYFEKEENLLFINTRNNLLKIISTSLKKVYKKLQNINLKLEECENMNKYRLYGELLTANLYKININSNIEFIELENYYENNSKIIIPLDKSISIQKNIEKYFKKYNKLKNALNIVSEQKKEAEKEIDYIESIVFNLENAKTMNDIKEVYDEISENITIKKELLKKQKNKQTKKNKNQDIIELQKIIIDGYTIYIGKNNIQNDYICLKFAKPNDIWFHTQKIHGSHILLQNHDNSEIPENILYECAKLAKENSKASFSSNVPVDYCLARYVRKPSGAKPGMVIYTNYKTIFVK